MGTEKIYKAIFIEGSKPKMNLKENGKYALVLRMQMRVSGSGNIEMVHL